LSLSVAHKKRTALYLSVAGLLLVVAGISAISAREPDGVTVRIGMTLVALGITLWLPWQALLPAVVAVWLGPNIGRSSVEEYELFNLNMMLELPGLIGLAALTTIARTALLRLEQEDIMLGMTSETVGNDPATGVIEESRLRGGLEQELSRSRRFGRSFGLVLVGIDEMRQRFDYRDQAAWQASFYATADLLRGTRANVDEVYRYGSSGFALILPESGPKDVNGLVRRLRRVARKAKPAEGEPGGPLPAHYGATFFPTCAVTVDDLFRRAEIALKIAESNPTRVQIDGAEAPEMPPVETLRQEGNDDSLDGLVVGNIPSLSLDEEPRLVLENVTPFELQTFETQQVEPLTNAGLEAIPVDLPATRPVFSVVDLISEELPREMTEAEDAGRPAEEPIAEATSERQLAEVAPEDTTVANVEIPAAEPQDEPSHGVTRPTPAVVYNRNWQAEAPLSMVRVPTPVMRPAPVAEAAAPQQPIEEKAVPPSSLDDTLQQLDRTLELIRSMKKRSA
jgi:GGDEF domain-containing protein